MSKKKVLEVVEVVMGILRPGGMYYKDGALYHQFKYGDGQPVVTMPEPALLDRVEEDTFVYAITDRVVLRNVGLAGNIDAGNRFIKSDPTIGSLIRALDNDRLKTIWDAEDVPKGISMLTIPCIFSYEVEDGSAGDPVYIGSLHQGICENTMDALGDPDYFL